MTSRGVHPLEGLGNEAMGEMQQEASRAQKKFQHQQRQGRTNNQYQQFRQLQGQQQQGHRQYAQAKKGDDSKRDFVDTNTWLVLSLLRNLSKEKVPKAFQRVMLKYHPNLQFQNLEHEKRRATKQSKIISDAYRKIQASYAKR
jgi:hypothetical protein